MPVVPPVTQIAPSRIYRDNQLNLLDPEPAFDPLLAVNRVAHVVKTLVINESINLVPLAEFRSVSKLVFLNASAKVVRNPNVERLGPVCQDVNAVAAVVAGVHRSFASLRMTGLDCARKICRKQ